MPSKCASSAVNGKFSNFFHLAWGDSIISFFAPLRCWDFWAFPELFSLEESCLIFVLCRETEAMVSYSTILVMSLLPSSKYILGEAIRYLQKYTDKILIGIKSVKKNGRNGIFTRLTLTISEQCASLLRFSFILSSLWCRLQKTVPVYILILIHKYFILEVLEISF